MNIFVITLYLAENHVLKGFSNALIFLALIGVFCSPRIAMLI